MARSKKGEEQQRAAFLDALGQTASVTKACELTNLPRRTVYNWRRADEGFASSWDEALELGTDALEDEAVRRAFHGTDKPVYQSKELVGHIREYSDTLLIFMLKARRPERFKDRVVTEHTGKDGGPIQTEEVSARDILADRLAGLAARRPAGADTGGAD